MDTHPIEPRDTSSVCGAAGVLTRMQGQVRELAETMWAARQPGELMDTVAEIEALKTRLDALELDVVRELEATDAVKPLGWASTQDFVTSVAGGHKGTGPAVLRLAKATSEPLFSPIGVAMADGWLSTAKAHVIHLAVETLPGNPEVRAAGVQALLAEAKGLDATALRKVGNRLASLVDPDGEERRDEQALDRLERAAHLDRFLTVTDDQAGGAFIRGRCTSEDAAHIKTTLMSLAAPRPTAQPDCDPTTCDTPGCSHDGRDPRDHGVRMLDALAEACRRLQSADLLPEAHGAVPRLTLTMSFDHLKDLTGIGETETGEQLSAAAVRRICCDSEVIPAVVGSPSEVLDVGRQQRLVTTAIWKALVVRDRHCRFPGCTRPPLMCHAHHLAALDRRRPDVAGQHDPVVRPPPPTDPRRALDDTPPAPASSTFEPPPGRRRSPRPPPDG